MAKAPRFVLALLGALLISGCAARSVHVAQLKDQPAKYYNKSVNVNGVVTRKLGTAARAVPVLQRRRRTGQITVIGHSGRVPSTGTRVNVKGACRNWRRSAASRSGCTSTKRSGRSSTRLTR